MALNSPYRSGGEACICKDQVKQNGGHLERMRSSVQGHPAVVWVRTDKIYEVLKLFYG